MHVLEPLTDEDERRLTEALRVHFGVDVVQWRRLGGELDINYRAILAGGDARCHTGGTVTGAGDARSVRFVRLSPAPFDEASLSWQNAVLEQLERSPLSVATPVLQRGVDEGVEAPFTSLDGREFRIRVTTWIPGSNVSELGVVGALYRRRLGALAAEIPESLAPLVDRREGLIEHHWVAVRAGTSIRETWHAVDQPDRRALLEEAVRRFDVIEARLSHLPMAAVHQDLHDFNLLAERAAADGAVRITGIVDFNDAVITVRVAELAVAAVYAALRQRDAFEAFTDVVEGYLAHTSLTDDELTVLYPLAVARLAVNGSTWTARAGQGNRAYAESRMSAAWPALRQLLAVDPEQAESRFRALTPRP
ncbi:phosphotransferase [Leucobacter sp. NPDC058333]|uniref:phosphotransferase n=1 Tax=Leucobacter sp. NPDC058333 TaxID=3346450 RepID=UPI003660FF7B